MTALDLGVERRIHNTMYFENTTEIEVITILKTLNVRKNPDIDNIRSVDIKNNADVMTPVITKLINSTICGSSIPVELKYKVTV